jgi:hypothetical protein
MVNALRFAGRFLLVLLAIVVALRLVSLSFALSRWAGFLAVSIIGIVLYATAEHWVRGLPGLLAFGVFNSVLGVATHHAPTNPRVMVSEGVAGLSLAFYTVGCIVYWLYDDSSLSVVDRLAVLVYLFCMVWPAFAVNNPVTLTRAVAWSTGVGMTAIVGAFAGRRARRWRSE